MKKVERIILWALCIGGAIAQAITYIAEHAPAN